MSKYLLGPKYNKPNPSSMKQRKQYSPIVISLNDLTLKGQGNRVAFARLYPDDLLQMGPSERWYYLSHNGEKAAMVFLRTKVIATP